jgi:hypothetical protein
MIVQLELFPASGIVHVPTIVEIPVRYVIEGRTRADDVWKVATWFRWSCSCGAEPPEINRWSHRERAERMFDHHVERP